MILSCLGFLCSIMLQKTRVCSTYSQEHAVSAEHPPQSTSYNHCYHMSMLSSNLVLVVATSLVFSLTSDGPVSATNIVII